MKKVFALILALCMVCALCSVAAFADDFPNGPITLMLNVAAGGASEQGVRLWQPYFEKAIGVPLNIEYHDGANGQVGYTVTSKSPADGYYLGLYDPSTIASTMINQQPEYDYDSFDYICTYMKDPGCFFANKNEPWKTLTELIEYAKTQPEATVTVGVAAMNDANVLGVRQIEDATGIVFNIVPFNGGGKARTALAGDQIPTGSFMYFGASAVWEDVVVLGRAVKETNVKALKEVESYSEACGKDLFDVYSVNGICAPAGLRENYPERYQKLCDAFEQAFSDPELLAKLAELDQTDWLVPLIGQEALVKQNETTYEFIKTTAHYLK